MAYLNIAKSNILNLLALICIQFSNALLPLIAFPALLNVIGSEHFSDIAFTEATSLIILAFVLYSFDVEGVSKISHLDIKKDIYQLSSIYTTIIYSRIIIWLIIAIPMYIAYLGLHKKTLNLLLWWMLVPLSNVFNSYWLFQGLEKNIFPALLTLLSRVICLFLLITLVTSPTDYHRIPIIIGITYISSGILSLIYIRLYLNIKITKKNWKEIKNAFADGKEIFFSNIAVTLFRNMNVIILGFVSTPQSVSVYSIAEKAIKIFQAFARPLNQLFFPKVIRSIAEYKHPCKLAFKKILKYTIPQICLLLISAITIGLTYIVLRSQYPEYFRIIHEEKIVYLITLMSVAVLFGVSNYMFGTAGLNYLNNKKYVAKSIFLTGFLNLFICSLLCFKFSDQGAALSFVASEFILFSLITAKYINN